MASPRSRGATSGWGHTTAGAISCLKGTRRNTTRRRSSVGIKRRLGQETRRCTATGSTVSGRDDPFDGFSISLFRRRVGVTQGEEETRPLIRAIACVSGQGG